MTATPVPGALTAPAEDCLKAIYDLERSGQGAAVTTNALAHRLDLAAASVTGVVKRLADQGLIKKVKGTLRPTLKGWIVARLAKP